MSDKKGRQPAFPTEKGDAFERIFPGMTYRQYLAAHAPKEIPDWFRRLHGICEEKTDCTTIFHLSKCVNCSLAIMKRIGEWPWYWADMVLEAEEK